MVSDIVIEKRITNCDNAFTARDRYDVLYTGEENDVGVGSGRRRRLLDLYGFCFSVSYVIRGCVSECLGVIKFVDVRL